MKETACEKEFKKSKEKYYTIIKNYISPGLIGKPEGSATHENLKSIQACISQRESSRPIKPIKILKKRAQSNYPWKWVVLGTLGVATVITIYYKYRYLSTSFGLEDEIFSDKTRPSEDTTENDKEYIKPYFKKHLVPRLKEQTVTPSPKEAQSSLKNLLHNSFLSIPKMCKREDPPGCYKPPINSEKQCQAPSSSLEEYQCFVGHYLNPKICVFSSYSYPQQPQRINCAKKVVANQRSYCNKHGYQYLEYNRNLAVEKTADGEMKEWLPYWSKIAGILRILNAEEPSLKERPEWIVWMDDDAVITNSKVRIEDILLRNRKGNPNVIMTRDSISHMLTNIPLNTAIIMVRNNPWSQNFFNQVWEMRSQSPEGQFYAYGNCPQQSCLHEQQAITDLLNIKNDLAQHIKLIPQRDPETEMGMNTFSRENHYDCNRYKFLEYDTDAPLSRWREGDFIGQATGMSTNGMTTKGGTLKIPEIRNLREEHINRMLTNAY